MLKIFDEIIMSTQAVDKFYSEYNENSDFKRWIIKEIPELICCENQSQNNPWHKYNVLGHILHSIEEMNKQTIGMLKAERRILAYTMLMHDIGKPATHIVRNKDGKMIDSFFNHNIKSEEIAKHILSNFNFTKEEIEIIAKLVYKHDIFMFIKEYPTKNPYWKQISHKLLSEEIADLSEVGDGEKLMRWLVMVGRSDSLAQNEKMTGEALALLDKFDIMLNVRDRIV